MTAYFIIALFIFIILYDVFLLIKNGGTITSVIRRWYVSFPLVPFIVAVLFLGHMIDVIHISSKWYWTVAGLGGSGIVMTIWSVYLTKKKVILPKWYLPIIFGIGYLVGDLFF